MQATDTVPEIWKAQLPSEWPLAPQWMSFTTLQSIERCPLQWSLSRASYPAIWASPGYPDRLILPSIVGLIIHRAVETVTKTLGRTTVSETENRIVSAIKAVGGLTALLANISEDVVQHMATNPRVAGSERDLAGQLTRKIPTMRTRLQKLLSRISHDSPDPQMPASSSQNKPASKALRPGLNPEVSLQDKALYWKGTADLIRVDRVGAEITDFKTGEESADHEEQILLYAYLLSQDTVVNPFNIPVTHLTIAYPDRSVSIKPPPSAVLETFITTMTVRADSARNAVSTHPPAPILREDSCPSCGVRQLCHAYWSEFLATDVKGGNSAAFVDAEINVIKKRSSHAWEASVIACKHLLPGSHVMIRCQPGMLLNASLLDSITHARLLSAQLTIGPEDFTIPTFTLTRATEVFSV